MIFYFGFLKAIFGYDIVIISINVMKSLTLKVWNKSHFFLSFQLIVRQLSGINDGVNSFQHSMVIIQASDGRLNDKVDVITSKTSDTNTKVTNIQTRVNDIATKFNSIRSTVDSINSKPDGIKETSDRVNDHANNIRTSSEEISKNVVEVDEKWKSIATSIDPVLFNATVTSRKLDVLLNVMTNIRSQLSRLDNQIN